MFCENVINMLPTIFKCALKYKAHSGVQVYKLVCSIAWSGSWLFYVLNLDCIKMSEGSAKKYSVMSIVFLNDTPHRNWLAIL